jgi:hypothetical protein
MSRRKRKLSVAALTTVGWVLIVLGLAVATLLGAEAISFRFYVVLTALVIGAVVLGIATLHLAEEIRKRLGQGAFCPRCEYDLHATSSERCPECGWKRTPA